jgi:hypothetical protein
MVEKERWLIQTSTRRAPLHGPRADIVSESTYYAQNITDTSVTVQLVMIEGLEYESDERKNLTDGRRRKFKQAGHGPWKVRSTRVCWTN